MSFVRLIEGGGLIICAAVGAFVLASGLGRAAEPFPFDQDLLLDVAPMPPVKRVPVLNIAANGDATIDLWCRTVPGHATVTDSDFHIEPGPLPDALPQYMTEGQCTPERMQADADTLASLAKVTAWRRDGDAVVLIGASTLRFLPSDH
jgi:heat shock protein HslJ